MKPTLMCVGEHDDVYRSALNYPGKIFLQSERRL